MNTGINHPKHQLTILIWYSLAALSGDPRHFLQDELDPQPCRLVDRTFFMFISDLHLLKSSIFLVWFFMPSILTSAEEVLAANIHKFALQDSSQIFILGWGLAVAQDESQTILEQDLLTLLHCVFFRISQTWFEKGAVFLVTGLSRRD